MLDVTDLRLKVVYPGLWFLPMVPRLTKREFRSWDLFTLLVCASNLLRAILMRPENIYGLYQLKKY